MNAHSLSQFFANAQEYSEPESAQRLSKEMHSLTVTDVEHITHAFIALDRKWHVVYISQQAARLLQKTSAELLGKQFWEVFPAFVASPLYLNCQQAASSGIPSAFIVESSHHHKWLHLHIYPSSEEIAIFLTDITLQKQIDAQLDFQATILRYINDCVIVTDLQGYIIYWNKEASAIFGYAAHEVLGKTPALLYPDWERKQATHDFKQILTGIDYIGEWEGKRKDGTSVWLDLKTTILRDGQGKEIGLIGISKDITERKRLTEEVAKAKEQLAVILKNVDDGILVQDAAGHIIYANDMVATMAGYGSAQDMVEAPMLAYLERFDLIDEQGHPFPASRLPGRLAILGEVAPQATVGFINKQTRHIRWVLIRSTRLVEHAEMSSFVLSVLLDITSFKEQEQKKNQFISIASHELRTPVTSIMGFAEILQMLVSAGQLPQSSQSQVAINTIIEQSSRLTRLIEEMLDLSRIEQRQLLLTPVPTDLLAILKHVIASQEITTKHHTIYLILDGLFTIDTLIGNFDADRLEQVFNNLIGNAIKYSPAGGAIEVGVQVAPDASHEVLIWVKDQGLGIPPAELPHIFERFRRADNLDRSISGLGIGLYLVKDLVMRHGGRVWVENNAGPGSTFFVALPYIKK